MKWRILILFAAMHGALADEAADAIALGRSARADGVPGAAVYALKNASAHAVGREAVDVQVELARCLIDADREDEVIAALQKEDYNKEPEIIFWRAQARAQKGDFEKALADYTLASRIKFSLREDSRLGRARMLEALGRSGEALDIYRKIPRESPRYAAAQLAISGILIRQGRQSDARKVLDDMTPGTRREQDMKRYLQARLALESDDAKSARRLYEKFDPANPLLAAGAAIGRVDATARLEDNEKAEAEIESFVRENPRTLLLGDVLAKLDELRAGEKNPSNATLKLWEKDDDNPELSAAASYYLAMSDERQGRTDRAIRNYAEFIAAYPRNSLRISAVIRLGRLLANAGQTKSAIETLKSAGNVEDRADGARLRFLDASTRYQSKDFDAAAKTFIGAANLDPKLSENALANAAISAISASNEPLAAEILNSLRKQNAASARAIELVQAFQGARQGNPDAGEQLAWLADRGGAIGNRARLASAEWRWQGGDRLGAQSEFIKVANSKAAGRDDQKDYFAVYLADDGSTKAVAAVTAAARDFLSQHPDSPREADVRMKWGEVLMRGGDYRGARAQFEEAAKNADDPSVRQSALFLAARAAAGSMSAAEIDAAIQFLEDVATAKTEPLASQARLEQAMLQSALNHPEESVKILDSLIATAKDPRLLVSARMKKGEALLAMGAKDKARIQDAVVVWRDVAADPGVLPAERNEALSRAGDASEQAGDFDGALAAYYEVLSAPRDKQPEYFWYYRAGFEAANLLDSHKRFAEEAAIFEKMAAAPGPRAEEAKERVKRLRLGNFIWED